MVVLHSYLSLLEGKWLHNHCAPVLPSNLLRWALPSDRRLRRRTPFTRRARVGLEGWTRVTLGFLLLRRLDHLNNGNSKKKTMRSSQEIGESYIFTMSFPAVRFTPGFGMRPTSITTKHQPGLHGAHTGLFLTEVSEMAAMNLP